MNLTKSAPRSDVFTVAIVDDHLDEMGIIKRYIDVDLSLQMLFAESDPVKALDLLEENAVDILILDMQMEKLNGVQLLQALRHRPKVIVCSNHTDYAYQTSPFQAAYIAKTVGRKYFEEIITTIKWDLKRIKNRQAATSENIIEIKTFKSAGHHVHIDISKLVYAEIAENMMSFYLEDSDMELGSAMVEIQGLITMRVLRGLLDSTQYVQCHRSFLVNLAQVESSSAKVIHLQNNRGNIPIGASYLKRYKEKNQFWRRQCAAANQKI